MYEYIGIMLGARPILHISRAKVKVVPETLQANFLLLQKLASFLFLISPRQIILTFFTNYKTLVYFKT
jgi:hypothetical protein